MFSLEIEETPDFIRFTVTGILNCRTDKEIDQRITEACEARGESRALIDIRAMEGRLSLAENFEAAMTFGARLSPCVEKAAILDLQSHHARSAMFEITATNRGACVRFFEEVSAAEAWLRAV